MRRSTNHPITALRALSALAQDPDDLPKVFKIIEALPGRSAERTLARTAASAAGRRLLATRPDLGARLADRAALATLPPGSLGAAYLEMTARARINAAGIVEASMAEREAPLEEGDQKFVGERMRDTHDLWHVVTGYGTDVLGELALLAFTYAQVPQPGIGLIIGFAYLQGVAPVNAEMRAAYRRGKSATWLPIVAWEQLLARPLDEVRAELGVGAPAVYTPIASASLRSDTPVWRRIFSGSFFSTGAPS
jgi:ubiquinone biosynthesis protein COQ4